MASPPAPSNMAGLVAVAAMASTWEHAAPAGRAREARLCNASCGGDAKRCALIIKPDIAARTEPDLVEAAGRGEDAGDPLARFRDRETGRGSRSALGLSGGDGLTTREVAKELGLSSITVHFHETRTESITESTSRKLTNL